MSVGSGPYVIKTSGAQHSGPWGTHGTMTAAGWPQVIDQSAEVGMPLVQQ
jgi:hypothetical protein